MELLASKALWSVAAGLIAGAGALIRIIILQERKRINKDLESLSDDLVGVEEQLDEKMKAVLQPIADKVNEIGEAVEELEEDFHKVDKDLATFKAYTKGKTDAN